MLTQVNGCSCLLFIVQVHIVVVPRDPALKLCTEDPLAENRTIDAYERITAATGGHLIVSKLWSLAAAEKGLTDLRRAMGFMYQELLFPLLSAWLADTRLWPDDRELPAGTQLAFPRLDARDTILVRLLAPPLAQRFAGRLYNYVLSFAIDKCVEEFDVVVSGESVHMQLYNPGTFLLYIVFAIEMLLMFALAI